jgi:SHS2 domain-containing protein
MNPLVYDEDMLPGGFEVLEHPADIGFRAYASTLAEVYVASAIAMLSIADDPAAAEPRVRYPLAVESGDRESLMVDWLSEVLYWYDGKGIAFREFQVEAFREDAIRAIGLGEPRDAERHRARVIVKAVTYHQLKIERRGDLWVTEVYLDI